MLEIPFDLARAKRGVDPSIVTMSVCSSNLARVLTSVSDMEEEKASASSNSYKVRAYVKAITAIGQLPEQVRSVEQVRHASSFLST